ncbi:rheacalcin-1-like [Pogoniulus pusillus]|uniref:rheacalcin-1-like n=1 Tax=Pogoniulus pusillus TaxID=488313 RepID=UPI0030B922DC
MGPVAVLGFVVLSCLLLHPPLPVAPHPGVPVAVKCPPGWLALRGHCYGYFGQELAWRKAEAWCRATRGGCHLASLPNRDEHRALAAFIAQRQRQEEEEGDVWIGLHRRGPAWLWADGLPQRYSAWDGDDTPPGGPCVALEDSAGFLAWDDDACGERKPFVCKCAA